MTAVEWLFDKWHNERLWEWEKIESWFEQAKKMEKENRSEDLIGFQIYLNDKDLITNHDWDFEKMAKLYLKKQYGK